ncbi:unnamed protein product [Vicia faba]|uniref:Pentatricopeptide repeat-containing protein n=1 Tax=Vicia faba TaxID=3906 RepID=A0AAV0ZN98_VICFA|nr:unnamed protein product [Vicia faba]
MYSKCGEIHMARRMFDRMWVMDEVSWATMMVAYVQHGCYFEVLELFDKITHDPFREIESESRAERSLVKKREPKEIHVEPDLINLVPTFVKDLVLLLWNDKFCAGRPTQTQAYNIFEVPNSLGLAFLFRAGDVMLMDFKDPHNPLCVYKTCLNILPFAMEERTYTDDSCKLHELDNEGFSVAACTLLQLSDYDPIVH